ncbi:MAG: AbrB/MazE/SpoVT family DNA-binding domain-containing protein [SAR324 cluster bacterium]|uniref:AbrB/MazE/SpoVT family DNA-binding domain-containing protein n=1 Tax=SAR324 cluster bacterium TaxID=2024889 RepID=A0A7X9IKU5_9DELT|nr:AbrB/MazE/SpoVT family DNA-binding domain-containing protein [SAR324 cluster bacterium]
MKDKSSKKPQSKMTVFGTAPVSSRGQIVIPAKLRKAQNINPGDTLIFTGNPESGYFHVLNANSFKGFTNDLNNLVFNHKQEADPAKKEKNVKEPTEKEDGK